MRGTRLLTELGINQVRPAASSIGADLEHPLQQRLVDDRRRFPHHAACCRQARSRQSMARLMSWMATTTSNPCAASCLSSRSSAICDADPAPRVRQQQHRPVGLRLGHSCSRVRASAPAAAPPDNRLKSRASRAQFQASHIHLPQPVPGHQGPLLQPQARHLEHRDVEQLGLALGRHGAALQARASSGVVMASPQQDGAIGERRTRQCP